MISEVFNIDCMLGMPQFPDKFFELAICDPNYGIKISRKNYLGGDKNGCSKAIQKNGSKLSVKPKFYESKEWDEERASVEYFNELRRVTKNQIIWGGNYFSDILPASSGWIFWDKEQTGNYSDGELAWTSFDCAIMKIVVRWNGFLQYDMSNKEERIHPTHKPIPLYVRSIKKFAKPGDKILDTHLGSQSSRIAAYKLGFDFWGYEIDADYFKQGCERFEKAIAEPLFDKPKPVQTQLL